MDLRIAHYEGTLGETQAMALTAQLAKLLPDSNVTSAAVKPPDSVDHSEGVLASPLDVCLMNSEADVYIAALQDVSILMSEGLKLGAVTQRVDPRDVAVTEQGLPLSAMPEGTQVIVDGTRRGLQVRALRADLEPIAVAMRPEELSKSIEAGDDQAGIFAMCDLKWMHLESRAAEIFSVDDMMPAAGQGALGLVVRDIDSVASQAVLAVNHKSTMTCITAERALISALGWNTSGPIGTSARLEDDKIELKASAFGTNGEVACAEGTGSADDIESLAKSVAEDLMRAGGERIVREARLVTF